ncbi:ABC transporter permease subunit [Streptomyces sp. ACA25]|uniref:ABC transporter permease n=1 Tax=Streptomyces sp. ACA25 TaxID=3022596 RepID=UPI002307FE07|nr:ABC transporter permease subunit [Streptomyces sp. ACA25]MDB1087489.1 ABC transporter permease subunit [Streptomyces sp. ACA25]
MSPPGTRPRPAARKPRRAPWATSCEAAALLLLLAAVLAGPLLAPGDPAQPQGLPWSPPDGGHWLGTDVLGRDVLSRLVAGGSGLLAVALPAGLAASALGTAAGLAATRHARTARVVLRGGAGLLAVPGLLVVLVCALAFDARTAVLAGMLLVGTPLSARVVYATAAPLARAGFVQAAVVRGEGPVAIAVRELLPAVSGTVLADAGLRVVGALQLTAAVSVLGLGPQPPATDWALMIKENLPAVSLNPAAALAPALALALLATTIAVGLDLLARRLSPETGR